jgi:hypothetical protein
MVLNFPQQRNAVKIIVSADFIGFFFPVNVKPVKSVKFRELTKFILLASISKVAQLIQRSYEPDD